MNSTKAFAVISIMLGLTAMVIPYFFGTLAVMVLGGVILASGIVSLYYMYYVRRQGFLISVFGPWVHVISGIVILVWPELTLWLIAVLLGAGLILNGITGLAAIRDSGVINIPVTHKIEQWLSILLGVLLIVMGSFGSAILLGFILGIALISAGIQQWRWQ
jgi:membrane protein HdeD